MVPAQSSLASGLVFDLENECLWDGKRSIALTPRLFALLRYLVGHPDQLLTKDDILANVWQNTHVQPHGVKQLMGALRKALGDPVEGGRFIETVPRRGYRFKGGIALKASGGPVARAHALGQADARAPHAQAQTLVGREAELEELRRRLQQALAGERQLVFVTGEAGIGKTSLISTFLKDAVARDDCWTISGHCIKGIRAAEPYLPILEAIGQLLRSRERARLSAVVRRFAPAWVRLLAVDGMSRVPPRAPKPATVVPQGQMLRQMAEFLEQLTASRGLILWLEDLGWADDSTLLFLSYLAERHAPARLLVIGTHRPVKQLPADHPLRAITAELVARGRAERLALPPLSQEDVIAYVARYFRDIPRQFATLLYARSGGHPLFVDRLLSHLVAQGALVQTLQGWVLRHSLSQIAAEIPGSIRDAIDHRVDLLTPDQQEALETSSVAGLSFATASVAAALDKSVESVEMICETLARRKVFLQRGGLIHWPDGTLSSGYEFRHPLCHQVIYERMSPARQVRLHQAIGSRLERAYGKETETVSADLATHFERGQVGLKAVSYLIEAAEVALSRSAMPEAIQLLERATDLLKTLPRTATRMRHERTLRRKLRTTRVAAQSQ